MYSGSRYPGWYRKVKKCGKGRGNNVTVVMAARFRLLGGSHGECHWIPTAWLELYTCGFAAAPTSDPKEQQVHGHANDGATGQVWAGEELHQGAGTIWGQGDLAGRHGRISSIWSSNCWKSSGFASNFSSNAGKIPLNPWPPRCSLSSPAPPSRTDVANPKFRLASYCESQVESRKVLWDASEEAVGPFTIGTSAWWPCLAKANATSVFLPNIYMCSDMSMDLKSYTYTYACPYWIYEYMYIYIYI